MRCPTCKGHGTVPVAYDHQTGRWHDDDCPTCHGHGDLPADDTRPYVAALAVSLGVAALSGLRLDDPFQHVAIFCFTLALTLTAAAVARRGGAT